MTGRSHSLNSSSSVTKEDGSSPDLSPSELAIISLNEILAMLDGRITPSDTEPQTRGTNHLIIEIPSHNYKEFLERMDYVGVREPHFPEQPSGELDMLRLQIKIEGR